MISNKPDFTPRQSDTRAMIMMGEFLRDLISFIDTGAPDMTLNQIRERAVRALRGEKEISQQL